MNRSLINKAVRYALYSGCAKPLHIAAPVSWSGEDESRTSNTRPVRTEKMQVQTDSLRGEK